MGKSICRQRRRNDCYWRHLHQKITSILVAGEQVRVRETQTVAWRARAAGSNRSDTSESQASGKIAGGVAAKPKKKMIKVEL